MTETPNAELLRLTALEAVRKCSSEDGGLYGSARMITAITNNDRAEIERIIVEIVDNRLDWFFLWGGVLAGCCVAAEELVGDPFVISDALRRLPEHAPKGTFNEKLILKCRNLLAIIRDENRVGDTGVIYALLKDCEAPELAKMSAIIIIISRAFFLKHIAQMQERRRHGGLQRLLRDIREVPENITVDEPIPSKLTDKGIGDIDV